MMLAKADAGFIPPDEQAGNKEAHYKSVNSAPRNIKRIMFTYIHLCVPYQKCPYPNPVAIADTHVTEAPEPERSQGKMIGGMRGGETVPSATTDQMTEMPFQFFIITGTHPLK